MNSQNTTGAQIYDVLRGIMILQQRQMNNETQDLGINSQQGRLLGFVAQHEGIIQKDLADLLHRRGASVTSMLQGLEKKGFIERRVPDHNERQKQIFLLPAGQAAVNSSTKIFKQAETDIVANLSPDEQQQLLQLLSKVQTGLIEKSNLSTN